MTPIDFEIHFGPQGDHEEQALSLARRLFAVYDTGIDSLLLTPFDDDDLTLSFNGELVTSLRQHGRPPAVADIRALFKERGIVVTRRPGPEEGLDEEDLANQD